MSAYKCISNFGKGSDLQNHNPLTYCLSQKLDNHFTNGSTGSKIGGANGKNCNAFMAQYCSVKWDDVCELASKNKSTIYPNNIQKHKTDTHNCLTTGDILIQNTATRKYIVETGGSCRIKHEPFDPTVASSPLVTFLEDNGGCVPIYAVDPSQIDNDPVMNKILDKPIIAWSLLLNIYNSAKRKGTLKDLENTKIYRLFMSDSFQNYLKELDI